MASPHEQSTYAFTDPLGLSDAAATRRRIRFALALMYGAAAPSLVLAALTDGGPVSQRLVAGGASVATGVLAILLLLWRRAPDGLLLAAFPLAALTVTAVAALDPPLALTPMYYVWPLMTATYFLRPAAFLLTYAVVCGSFGAVSAWVLDHGPRTIQWATVAIVGAVLVAFVAALKRGVDDLVTRLHRLSREDPLTGALNRRAFMEHVDAEIARAHRAEGSCAIAIVDIDHFKDVNDRFGHARGDAALRSLVATVTRRLRRGDALGRLGGEEFAVLLAGTDAEGAAAYADELRGLVAEDAILSGTPFTVSVGIASAPDAGASAEGLLAAADAALYAAKRAGRDVVRTA